MNTPRTEPKPGIWRPLLTLIASYVLAPIAVLFAIGMVFITVVVGGCGKCDLAHATKTFERNQAFIEALPPQFEAGTPGEFNFSRENSPPSAPNADLWQAVLSELNAHSMTVTHGEDGIVDEIVIHLKDFDGDFFDKFNGVIWRASGEMSEENWPGDVFEECSEEAHRHLSSREEKTVFVECRIAPHWSAYAMSY